MTSAPGSRIAHTDAIRPSEQFEMAVTAPGPTHDSSEPSSRSVYGPRLSRPDSRMPRASWRNPSTSSRSGTWNGIDGAAVVIKGGHSPGWPATDGLAEGYRGDATSSGHRIRRRGRPRGGLAS